MTIKTIVFVGVVYNHVEEQGYAEDRDGNRFPVDYVEYMKIRRAIASTGEYKYVYEDYSECTAAELIARY
ncbi:hypothetical protein OMDBNIEC_00054 [Salmonella phage STP-SP5]|nr:hypothetical protein OMDBNIEC_00054 [Salmonella phage STP-SP5]